MEWGQNARMRGDIPITQLSIVSTLGTRISLRVSFVSFVFYSLFHSLFLFWWTPSSRSPTLSPIRPNPHPSPIQVVLYRTRLRVLRDFRSDSEPNPTIDSRELVAWVVGGEDRQDRVDRGHSPEQKKNSNSNPLSIPV